MGDEDFLDAISANDEPVEEPKAEPAPATPEEPAAQPEPAEQPRDEHGKFKAKEAEAEPSPAPQPEPQAQEPAAEPPPAVAPQPEAQQAPVSALIDERLKRQKAEDDARRANEELQRLRAAQQPEEVPDPDQDPVGFARYQQAQVQNILTNERLNVSERFARKEHGAETVQAAQEWAKAKFAADPLYHQAILTDQDPYERLVTDYRREQFFSQVNDPSELDEFRAWKAAKGQLAQQTAAPAAPPNPAPSIPPPSLASAPSAGGILTEVELTDQDIFEGTIPKG